MSTGEYLFTWIMGIFMGAMLGVAIMQAVNEPNKPTDSFVAVCEDRGGVVYGATGCFKPDDAIYTVEADK